MKPALYCSECWRYVGQSDGGGDYYETPIIWIVCNWCKAGRPTLRQPMTCLQCREPFDATRQAQKFCSSSCRARAWRERQQVAS
jgi:hypothetical protein